VRGPARPGTDASLVGTAIGYVLSAHLRDDALDETVATTGARLLDRPLSGMHPLPSEVERRVVERVRGLGPSRGTLAGAGWDEFLRLCCVLARFEQIYRAGPAVVQHVVGPLVEHAEDLDGLGRAVVSAPTLSDLDGLGRATLEDLTHLRKARRLDIGPTFAQSLALGGADADLIYDETLAELKSSGGARIVGRNEAWQLLGYLLADSDNRFDIRRLSVLALRRRRSITWEAQELIDALAGGPTPPVEHWRAEFAELLETAQRRA
jgi:hypothetical protein